MNKIIIVGAGFSGASAARMLAEKGYEIDLYEKRDTIGGNCFDYTDESGVIVQKYGAHLFHTTHADVMEFLNRFSDFFAYRHSVLGEIDSVLVPIPFNLQSLQKLFPKDEAFALREKLIDTYGMGTKIPIAEMKTSGDADIKKLAEYVYEKVFLHYTEKQWHLKLEQLSPGVGARVPVSISDESEYFGDPYQCMPSRGFTPIFEKMLDHSAIHVHLNTDVFDYLSVNGADLYWNGEKLSVPVIYTGCLDELLSFEHGVLPYRSLKFDYKQIDKETYQPCGVVNYPGMEPYTRILEFKHFTSDKIIGDKTTIAYEYPCDYHAGVGSDGEKNTPYYPIPKDENETLYQKYRKKSDSIENLHLLGRLAEYKYYNMDQSIKSAIELAKQF